MTEAALEHALLEQLVAAFADGELPPEEARLVQDHLRSCARCQRELALQQGLSRALAQEPARGPSAGLRRRIEQIGPPMPRRGDFRWKRSWAAPAAAALVLIGVAGGTALFTRRGEASRPIAEIPLLRDAVADCRRVMARNFPRQADLQAVAEGLQFPAALSAGQAPSSSAPGRRRSPDLRPPASPIAGEGSSWSSTRCRPSSSGSSQT